MKIAFALTGVFFSLAIVFAIWYFLFNVYEVKVIAENKGAAKPNGSQIIEVIGVNALGGKALFTKVKSKVEFLTGKELVNNVSALKDGFRFDLNDRQGKVKLKLKGKYFLAPAIVEFEVK